MLINDQTYFHRRCFSKNAARFEKGDNDLFFVQKFRVWETLRSNNPKL